MEENGFIKDINMLQENSKVDDLLDLSEYVDNYLSKIKWYSDKSMIALTWKFWVWKSTFLHQVENKLDSEKNIKWFEFDAWKYPDRSNLWESFTLELVNNIGEKEFENTIKVIDWTVHNDKKTISSMLSSLPVVKQMWGESLNHWFQYFLDKSPAKRTFEIQNILTDIITSLEEDSLYVVVEDIDRSWDNWIYFLETLNNFIKHANIVGKTIKIIVPVSEDSYLKNKASYHKCFDYINDYTTPEYKLDNFCKELFIDSITWKQVSEWWDINYVKTKEYWLLLEFLEGIFKYYNNNFTLRDLKLLLRNANEKYKSLIKIQWKWINFIICILVEASKQTIWNEWWETIYTLWMKNRIINQWGLFISVFICLIDSWEISIYDNNNKLKSTLTHKLKIKPFKLKDKDKNQDIYFYPWSFMQNKKDQYYYIWEFYFRD